MTQYGFFFDQSRCIGCNTCALGCKDWNNIPAGPAKFLRIFKWEKGTFPEMRVHTLFAPCYHCGNPVCVDAAEGAMYKEDKYGAVLIDPQKSSQPSLKKAWEACPYGAITFESDAPNAKAFLCNMCVDRLEQGMMPSCVMRCPMRALDFGTVASLREKYGTVQKLEDMPDPSTNPSVVFKAMDSTKKVILYDTAKALALIGTRPDGLSKTYESATDVTSIPAGTVGRDKLVMKPGSSEELMYYTRDYES